jgi:hypothetical protein
MLLMQTVQDETMPVPGFERHTFMCSSCDDVEHRLVFAKPTEQPSPQTVPADTVPMHVTSAPAASAGGAPLHVAPPISPAARAPEPTSAGGMFRRVLSKLRGG